jgi:hypothetical protein
MAWDYGERLQVQAVLLGIFTTSRRVHRLEDLTSQRRLADGLDALWRIVLHAVDDAAHRVRLHPFGRKRLNRVRSSGAIRKTIRENDE